MQVFYAVILLDNWTGRFGRIGRYKHFGRFWTMGDIWRQDVF